MSLRATLWALDEAPVSNPTAVLVLVGLGDEAKDDGTEACPYIDKLVQRARVSKRSVQSHLRDLYRARLIDFGDARVAQRRYRKKAGHAPRVWTLNLAATRSNVPPPRSDAEMAVYTRVIAQDNGASGGVQLLHPTADQAKQDDCGVQPAAPHSADGVQPVTRRGAAGCTPEVQPAAPFPLLPEDHPSPPRPPAAPAAPLVTKPGGGDDPPTSTSNPDPGNQVPRPSGLDALVAEIHAAQPGWKPTAIRRALQDATAAGREPAAATVAIRALASGAHGPTHTPGRLLADGPWWAAAGHSPGKARNLPPGAEQCCTHRGQPAKTCAACAGERLGVPDPESAGVPDPAARNQARQLAANLARQTRRQHTGAPAGLGGLLKADVS